MRSRNLTRGLLDDHLARGHESSLALVEPARSWTYGELARQVERAAAALVELGVGPGDRVALMMHDTLELAAALLGVARIGAMAAPLSTLLRLSDLRAILHDARPSVVLVHADLVTLLDEVCEELPSPPRLVVVSVANLPMGDFTDWALLLAQAKAPPELDDSDVPTLLLYSAGSSGPPKGVPHTAAEVKAAGAAFTRSVLALTGDDRVFTASRLFSAFGLGSALLFPLAAGASSYLLPSRIRPRNVFAAMAAFRPTVFFAAPSLYAQLLHDHSAEAANPFSSVRATISGTEPLAAELWRRLHDTFDIEILHGFGSTEALYFFLCARPGMIRPGSAGRPIDGYQVRLVDEKGQPVGVEEIGLLEVCGPSVARSYWRPPVATSSGLRPVPTSRVFRDGGWLHTGDRFMVDAEGWYHHTGRADDLFKVSGKWVVPSEVEATLLAHPAVWECAVIGGTDSNGLRIPVAYVVPNIGYPVDDRLGRELMEFVKQEIAPYKYPRRVEFVSELPKNDKGAVQRWRLRLP